MKSGERHGKKMFLRDFMQKKIARLGQSCPKLLLERFLLSLMEHWALFLISTATQRMPEGVAVAHRHVPSPDRAAANWASHCSGSWPQEGPVGGRRPAAFLAGLLGGEGRRRPRRGERFVGGGRGHRRGRRGTGGAAAAAAAA